MEHKAGLLFSLLLMGLKALIAKMGVSSSHSKSKRYRVLVDHSLKFKDLPRHRRIVVPGENWREEPELYTATIRVESDLYPIALAARLDDALEKGGFEKVQEVDLEPWPPAAVQPHGVGIEEPPLGWHLHLITRKAVPSDVLHGVVGEFDRLTNLTSRAEARAASTRKVAVRWVTGVLSIGLLASLASPSINEILLPAMVLLFVLGLIWFDFVSLLEAYANLQCVAARDL